MDYSIFKAYDIRGKYPSEINEDVMKEIIEIFFNSQLSKVSARGGSALGGKNQRLTIVIGHDARLSSPSLHKAALEVLSLNSKFQILNSGLITTPMMYFLVNHHDADYGIMITASHNPKEYNGIKIVGKKAKPISGKEVLNIIKS